MLQKEYEKLHDYVIDFYNDLEDEFYKYDNVKSEDDITNISYEICDYVSENYDDCKDMTYEEMYTYGITKVRQND
jgi:hypothetical protein